MRRHPLVAAFLSAVIPGTGQWYAGDPLRGLVVFSPAVVLAVGSWIFVARGTFGMAELLVRPTFLTGLLVANGMVLVWRCAAAIDAYLVATRRTESADQGGMWIALAAVLAVLAIPQVIVWTYGAQTISALNTVFVAGAEQIDHPGPTATTTIVANNSIGIIDPAFVDIPTVKARSVRNLVFRSGVGDPEAIEALPEIWAPVTPDVPFVPFEERVGKDRVTILLVGGDAGPGREGLRTDSMNVVTIDLETGAAAMFGLPRNLKLMPLPKHLERAFVDYEERVIEKDLTDEDLDGFPDTWVDTDGDGIPEEPAFESCKCFPEMLNEVHGQTLDWTTTYANEVDPGLAALRDIISYTLDLDIDYYFMVEMAGFVRTIDALGGVDVYVKKPYHVTVSSPEEGKPKASVSVEVGYNHLTGLESLAYARWRIGSSDYDRMGRQRCVIKAAATQADTVTLIRAFPQLLDLMKEYVTTDIPVSFLPDLVRIAGTIDYHNVATIGLSPPTYNSGRTPAHYPIPNVDRMRSKVRDIIENGVVAQSKSGLSECDPPPEES